MTTGQDNIAVTTGEYWAIDEIVDGLRAARARWREGHPRHVEHGRVGFPLRGEIEAIVAELRAALFPLRLGPDFVRLENENAFVAQALHTALQRLYGQIRLELGYALRGSPAAAIDREAGRIIGAFATALPGLRALLDTDIAAAYAGDPAARSVDEVLLCYPGALAIIHHRLAHRLHGLGAPLIARIMSEIAHARTGIDIHPGAVIGPSFFIDHGTGVVIGETAIVGARVRLYQAVTLGGLAVRFDDRAPAQAGLPRHPIVEDDVIIYAGATLLGRITIGRGATIGGNVWLTESVPPGATVEQSYPVRDL